jgi:septal ring factor EnvC (AmiA/AmiB activator)
MESKSNKSLKIFLILSLILNVALVIFVINLNNTKGEQTRQIEELTGTVSTKNSEIVAKTEELEGMAKDLERIKAEREQLGLANDSLDQKIAQLNSYVFKLKKASTLNAKERKELEEMVAQLREEITKKDAEIATLKVANDSLTTNVNNLTAEKQKLGDSLNMTAKELAYAAILKAEGIKVTALKENGKEMDEAEYKHSKIDRVKIQFSLADNKAAKQNTKRFFVSLVPPSGKPFCDMNNGGGSCMLADGSEVPYTLTQDLSFDNTNQKLAFTMFKGFNYIPGNYKVIVYSEGYKIGEGGFAVK